MNKEQLTAKVAEMEASKHQLILNTAAHDGYIQRLKEEITELETKPELVKDPKKGTVVELKDSIVDALVAVK